jgi:hypothetical protein
MAQTANQSVGAGLSGLAVRNGFNTNNAALFSSNSGTGEPPSPVGGMFWLDTDAVPPTLYQRNAANSAWRVISPETLAAFTLWGNGTGSAAAPGNVTVPQLLTMQGFLQNAATPYVIIPGPGGTGMAFQAGGASTGALGVTVTFPLTFISTPYLSTSVIKAGPGYVTLQSVGTSAFFAQGWNSAGVQTDTFFQWEAFGRYY